jgi:hypothetical protein
MPQIGQIIGDWTVLVDRLYREDMPLELKKDINIGRGVLF